MDLKNLRDICLGNNHKNYQLEHVDILSPYLSDSFFAKLQRLKPKEVYITTDAGCSSAVIKSIEKCARDVEFILLRDHMCTQIKGAY